MTVPARTTRREDTVTIVLALWTLIGLLVDAFKHSTDPELETFWTPWHALFYSGFIATAIWLTIVTLRRRRGGGSWFEWAPPGYKPALVGIALFSAGGVGDAIWHTVFGVETSLDALLSPTHLLLFVGLLLIMSAPLRSAWTDELTTPTLGEFAAPLASLVFSTTLVAFFFEHSWMTANVWPFQIEYNANVGPTEDLAMMIVLGMITTTLISFTPLLAVTRRWHVPFGVATLTLTSVTIAIAFGFDDDILGLPAVVVGAVVFDVLVIRKSPTWLQASAPVAVMWSGYIFLVGQTNQGLAMAPEIWGGGIVFSILAGLAANALLDLGGDLSRRTRDRETAMV